MCYKYPGPRCSAHAVQKLVRAQLLCEKTSYRKFDSDEEKMKEYDRVISLRTKAQLEFNATPAGMAILRQEMETSKWEYTRAKAKADLKDAKELRKRQLAKVNAKDVGDINNHSEERLSTVYSKLGLSSEFDTTNADRIGWDSDDDKYQASTSLIVKASNSWVKQLTPEQMAAVKWVTGHGSEVLSRHSQGHDLGSYAEEYSSEELDKRSELVKKAFAKAPKMPKPVVLYRGIGSQVPFDTEKVVKEGHYTAPSVLSATINPGVANQFGYKNIVLEMKTRRFPSPSNFSGAGPREVEVMIPPGAKFRVTGVIKDVAFGWSEKNKVEGYTVIQMEEIED